VDHGNRQHGVITWGLPYLSLLDALENTAFKPDILKLGIVYPLDHDQIGAFVREHQEVLVLEELDDLLEREIKAKAYDAGMTTRIFGKQDPGDWVGEYTADKVMGILRKVWPDLVPQTPSATATVPVPDRPPQMCPGCGHRSAFHAIKQALSAEDITVADIGCHTLGYLPPYEMGQLLMCMGASPGIGAGMSLFNTTRRVVVFMGDSTFYHAGLPGTINALYNQHNITMIVMENGTTAMTGHQDHAGSGRNINGPVPRLPIRQILEGLGVQAIFETDTYQQRQLTDLMRKALAVEGFSAVIARHPCILKFTREQRRKPGFEARRVEIDQEICERIHACVAVFGCPTFTREADGRITINPDLCIGDGSCLQTCPTQAITKPAKTGA
jgi:indolepyruvate ferredoxin oxidoreductase alpha subunit